MKWIENILRRFLNRQKHEVMKLKWQKVELERQLEQLKSNQEN